MGRVKAFITARNEHRSVNIGGRGSNREVSAGLNTDNSFFNDCCMKVSALVGENTDDDAITWFDVTLPGEQPKGWFAHICLPHSDFVSPRHMPKKLFPWLRNQYSHLDHVTIPAGFDLGYALACIAYCESRGISEEIPKGEEEETTKTSRRIIHRD